MRKRDIQPRRSPALCRTCRAIRGSRPMREGIYCLSSGRIYNFSNTDGLGDDFTYTMRRTTREMSGPVPTRDFCLQPQGRAEIRFDHHHGDGLPDNIVREIHPDGEQMWICMAGWRHLQMNAVTHAIDIPPPLRNWSYGTVNDLVVAGSRLWAGTKNHGISSLGSVTQERSRYSGTREDPNIPRSQGSWPTAKGTSGSWQALPDPHPRSRIEILAATGNRNFSKSTASSATATTISGTAITRASSGSVPVPHGLPNPSS